MTMHVLTNGVIELAPADVSLARAVRDYYMRNKAFLAPFDPVRNDYFYTVSYQYASLEADMKLADEDRGYRFYIRPCNEPDRVIGCIALSNIVRGAFQSCHLGYKLDEAYINRGYMTMAVKLMVDFAFHEIGLHRIEGNIMPGNVRSRRDVETCGFVCEGISEKYLKINGVWEDHVHMVILNEEMA